MKSLRHLGLLALFVALPLLALACADDDTPTATPATSPVVTASPADTATPTASPTPTPTAAILTVTATPDLTPTSPAGFPLTIELADGESLTLVQPPARIVSLSAYATAILCAAGAGAQLAAVDLYANCPDGSKALPELDSFQPSLEGVAGYDPDLVYVDSDNGGIVAALRALDIPVLYLAIPNSIDEALQRIELFSQVVGRQDEGGILLADLRTRLDAVTTAIADVTAGPRVYHELDETLFSVGPDSFVGDFYTVLKAQNIAAEAADAYPQLTAEAILAADPEVIVLADEPFGVTVESVTARPGWAEIAAVKNNRVCSVDPSLVSVWVLDHESASGSSVERACFWSARNVAAFTTRCANSNLSR